MNDIETTDDTIDNRYMVRLILYHPTMPAGRITEGLGVEPRRCWSVGDDRLTPKGSKLEGTWPETAWSVSRPVGGKRDFLGEAVRYLQTILGDKRAFVAEFHRGGGTIILTIDLPGDTNIGSVLDVESLAYLATWGVKLGIEVFPDF